MIHLVIVSAFVAVVLFVFVDAARRYRATPGTSILTAFEGSASVLWARLLAASSALIGALAGAAEYLHAPGVSEAIRELLRPEYIPLFGLVSAIVFEMSRRRTLGKGDGG